jgi:hypothetical protein
MHTRGMRKLFIVARLFVSSIAVLLGINTAAFSQEITQPPTFCFNEKFSVDLDGDGKNDQVERGRIMLSSDPNWRTVGPTNACVTYGDFMGNMVGAKELVFFNKETGVLSLVGLRRLGDANDLEKVTANVKIFNKFAINSPTTLYFLDINGDGLLDILGYWKGSGEVKVVMSPFPRTGNVIQADTWSCPIKKSDVINGTDVFFFQEAKGLIRAEFVLKNPPNRTLKYWIRPDGFRALAAVDAPNLGTRDCDTSP